MIDDDDKVQIMSLSPITIVVAKSRRVAFFVFSGYVKANFSNGFTIGRHIPRDADMSVRGVVSRNYDEKKLFPHRIRTSAI